MGLSELSVVITSAPENILRFSQAANKPPRAILCGVSSRPSLPQESTHFSYANVAIVHI